MTAIVLMVSFFCGLVACTHPVRRLVFQPHKIDPVPAFPKNLPGLQQIWLQTDQGKVEGWIMLDRATAPQRPGPAVLIAHGNRELIDSYLKRAVFYRDLGFVVLMGEYRGYGRSAGKPSRESIQSDFIRFYDKLAALPGVDAERIVFHGRSLGGAVLAELSQVASLLPLLLSPHSAPFKPWPMAHRIFCCRTTMIPDLQWPPLMAPY